MLRSWTIPAALGAGVLVATAAVSATAQGLAPPPELKGTYAPGGDCTKEPRVTLTDTALTITTGGKPIRLGPIDSCRTCVGGARYDGIEVWVSQLGADNNPKDFMFRFNADEKRGVLVVDRNGMQSFPPAVRAVATASPMKRCTK